MEKKQIRVTAEEVRNLIKEELDASGYKRYPEGMSSTEFSKNDEYEKNRPEELDMWKNNPESSEDTDKKRDMFARDEFKDEKEESDRYEKPFGDLDDIENQWDSEPGYEENDDDDDDDIAGISEGKVTLSEQGLRNFISYSVARILKEGYRPIYRSLGNGDYDYDGDEWDGGPNSYGSTEIELPNEAIIYALEDVAGIEFNDQYKQQFKAQYGQEPDEDDFVDDMMRRIGFDLTPRVSIDFDVTTSRGDYWTPGYTDVDLRSWEMDGGYKGYAQASDMGKKIMQAAAEWYIENNVDELYERINGDLYESRNLGITTHFNGESSFKPESELGNMTFDELRAYKAGKNKTEKEKEETEGKIEKPNRGVMVHFGGEKHERTPEEIERDEHLFDDQYWVDKMNLSKDELSEIISECVKRIMEGMGDEEEVVEQFPMKASGTFTMNTRRGNTDKYKVFVEKTSEEELLTDIFIYDPMDKEWYPQAEYVVDIEEYTNGSWLPYWETFNGDVSIRALANCFGKVVKLWKKVGYLFEEDDEIPFRYAGDIKGLNGKMF